MARAKNRIDAMRANPKGVRFADLVALCRVYFGEPRKTSGSHQVYRTPWAGDPRDNIQGFHGMAKPYQVRQVLAAIERLGEDQAKAATGQAGQIGQGNEREEE
ncbi:MAG: hypothetical protein LBG11_04775 [Bifidobacteriaceae bacterium]|nr:hypothetical protein [Bifidobacteriaceae bacterium]